MILYLKTEDKAESTDLIKELFLCDLALLVSILYIKNTYVYKTRLF